MDLGFRLLKRGQGTTRQEKGTACIGTQGLPSLNNGTHERGHVPRHARAAALGTSRAAAGDAAAVEKVSDFFVGIIVFLGVILVVTPPKVSTPKDNGVTSRSKISFTSPPNTPA